jgi:flagellar biosynthesis anti-sigma factor FlgM
MNKVDSLGGIKPQTQEPTANTDVDSGRSVTASIEADDPRAATNSVSLSETAQEISSFEIRLRALPGINLDRVEAIREAISSGDYIVDADKVVAGLLSSERARVIL